MAGTSVTAPKATGRAAVCGLVIAVHAQHVEASLDQSFRGLPVEVNLSMTAARRDLENDDEHHVQPACQR